MSALTELSLTALAAGVRAGTFSSRDVVEACLRRIEALDPKLNAFLSVEAEAALAEAEACDRDFAAGRPRGPLHGLPVAIKDIIDVAGKATTGHSRVTITDCAREDAFVVQRLRAAGAIIIGKTALHEFATGGPSFDLPWPPARNPWNPAYHPGGSSSGSGAAVACGMVPAALGTDTAGSVRHPATACGIVGMKPTYGAISRHGVFPLAPSLDQVGPMTRTVADNALLFDACLGHDPRDPTSIAAFEPVSPSMGHDIRGLRIAVLEDFNAEADAEILAAFDGAVSLLKDLGADVVPVTSPPVSLYNDCARLLIQAESFAVHQGWLAERPHDYGWRARTKLLAGAFIDAGTFLQTQKERRRLTVALREATAGFDAALCVSSFHLPAPIDDDDEIDRTYDRQARIAFNLTGDPAIAVCAGLSASGLPLGLQIVSHPFQDAMVYRIGAAYEAACEGSAYRTLACP